MFFNFMHKRPLTVFLTCSAAAAVVVPGGWWGISTSHLSSDSLKPQRKKKERAKKWDGEEITNQESQVSRNKKFEIMMTENVCLSLSFLRFIPLSMEEGLKWRQEQRGGEEGREGERERKGGNCETESERQSVFTPAVEGAEPVLSVRVFWNLSTIWGKQIKVNENRFNWGISA